METDPGKIDTILCEAVEIESAVERVAFLDKACGEDAELRHRLDKLIADHFRAGDFLEEPPAALAATVNQAITEGPGTVIGPYKLLQKIGEGGFGVVYVADQTEPVKRQVALKIIKPGMDTRQVIARFEAERQALAMMDHPNIAKVLDGGTTDSGRPYFVMELVNGVTITEYCDEHHLTPRERLELFVPVCEAVQHAHQKGIIHRDIKPSNVLVTEYDGRAVPKIIDFGVAKAIEQRLTERTVFTQLGQIVGTLHYMSPEQADLNQLDIDTRSDIYSLGVLLYELLTGETPFDGERLRAAAFDELLRIIREEEPPKPSLRLSTSASLPSTAANRKIEPKKLNTLVRGELDWIVMKALEKDRARRYETANGFASDIRRYLNDEPVVACPPSTAYRLKKFARRNKVAFSTAALVVIALLLGIAGTTWQAVRATKAERLAQQRYDDEREARHQTEKQRERAVAAEEDAKTEAAIAQAVNDFLNDDLLAQADPKNEPDRDIKLRTVVDRAAEEIEGRFADQPLVEAAIRQTLGSTYLGLGEYEKAEQHHKRARELRRCELGPEHAATLTSMSNLASAVNKQSWHAEAEKLHREVLEVKQRILGSDDPATLSSNVCLANSIQRLGRHAEAEDLYREVLKIQQEVLGPEHPSTMICTMNLANAIDRQGRHAEAENLRREVLQFQQRTPGPEHPSTLTTMHNLAVSLTRQGRHAEAENLCREVLEVEQRVLGSEHPLTILTRHLLAGSLADQGQFNEAGSLCREVFEACRRLHGLDDPKTLSKLNYFFAASEAAGTHAEAKNVWEEIREEVELKVKDDPFPSSESSDYRIRIEEPGEYQLYVRWGGCDGGSDSIYAALCKDEKDVLDWYLFQGADAGPDLGDADADFATHAWETFGGRRRVGTGDLGLRPERVVAEQPALFLVPAPGEYILRLLRREGGAAADALLFQQSHLPAPEQEGPLESPREGAGVFVVRNGTVTIEAEHFSSAPPSWLVLPGEKAGESRHKNFRGSGYLQLPE